MRKHEAAVAIYCHLMEDEGTHRQDAYRHFVGLYTNRDLGSGVGFSSYTNAATRIKSNRYSRVPFNIIKLMVDTVAARVGKFRPRPRYLTSEGDFGLRKRADRLQKWVDMQFYVTRLYENAPRVFLDACVCGLGVLKISSRGDEILAQRVYPGEILVSEHEAFHDEPTHFYQTKYITRDKLRSMFPKAKKEIAASGVMREGDHTALLSTSRVSDMVEVVEAWKIRPGDADGERIVFTDGGILAREAYPFPDPPFVFVRWMPEPRGFYGIGLAEDLLGIHHDVNTTIQKIDRSLELTATPMIFVPKGAGVDAKQITNTPGGVITYNGQIPPSVVTPSAVPNDVFAYLQQQIGRAQQIARLSDSAVGNRVPAGLETGQAVRNFHDIETESFSLVARQYEEMFLDAARKMVRAGKEISQRNPKYRALTSGKDRNTVESVPWADVELDDREDAYVIKVFPASSLSMTPSGRMANVQDLMNMGVVNTEEGKRLLDFEDLEEHTSNDRAASDNIDRMIELILEKGEYTPPSPFIDLRLAVKRAQQAVNRAQNQGVPADRVQKLRLFANQASALSKRAEREALAQQQMAVPDPAAAPPPDASGQPFGAVTGQEP